MKVERCRRCGDLYGVNPRLNDGYCPDCREEENREGFDEAEILADIRKGGEQVKREQMERNA